MPLKILMKKLIITLKVTKYNTNLPNSNISAIYFSNFQFTANIFLCYNVIIVFLMTVHTCRVVASSTIDSNVQLKTAACKLNVNNVMRFTRLQIILQP